MSEPIVDLVDFSGIEPVAKTLWPGRRRDYVSPGLVDPGLLARFPSVVEGDVADLQWPYLRKNAPHIWRRDLRGKRNPFIGVLSLDEATLLHNNALPFSGQRGLEIGCHYGWSTAHILTAMRDLDVIDPALGHEDQMRAVQDSLPSAARLWAGFSPNITPAVHAYRAQPWSFAFIDGWHEGHGPRDDARRTSIFMGDDALVLFHDMISPHVAAGLAVFADAGWRVGLYNTMQIMGVAWRGDAAPVAHVTDRDMPPADAEHLKRFPMLST